MRGFLPEWAENNRIFAAGEWHRPCSFGTVKFLRGGQNVNFAVQSLNRKHLIISSMIQPSVLLQAELDSRKMRNKSYSLRAFAKALDMNPTFLSSIIRRKKTLSEKRARVVAEKLGLDASETKALVRGLKTSRGEPIKMLVAKVVEEQEIPAAAFDWRVPALASLLSDGRILDGQAISEKFGIDLDRALALSEALVTLGLACKTEGGITRAVSASTVRLSGKPGYKKVIRDLQEMAQLRVEADEAQERTIFGATFFRCDEKDLPELKMKIRNAILNITNEFDSKHPNGNIWCCLNETFKALD